MTKNRGAMRPRIEKKCEQNTRKAKKKKIIGEKITKSLKILTSNIQKKKKEKLSNEDIV